MAYTKSPLAIETVTFSKIFEKSASVATSKQVELTEVAVTASIVTITFSMASAIAQSVVIVATDAAFFEPHLIYDHEDAQLLLLNLSIVHVFASIFAVHLPV